MLALLTALVVSGASRPSLSPIQNATGTKRMQDAPVAADLSWMAGSWSCPKWEGTFEENWMPPSAGTLQGVGKHVKAGKTTFMEFLSIEPGEKGLTMYIMIGSPAKQQFKAAFQLTALEGKKATFEFPDNDFPSKIVYERLSATSLKCTLSGTEEGKAKTDVFDFKPVKKS